ncbi:MAG: hypothetical protein FD130_976, partial [Halothiobacillaceae bacterium]
TAVVNAVGPAVGLLSEKVLLAKQSL